VPLASPRSVLSAAKSDAPASCQVSQSWGRHTAAVRAACSGSCSASQRSLVTVNDATGTEPTRSAQARGPPNSATSSAAAPAERVSFHSRAGRTTSPCSSRHTMPCCCAPTATATTSTIPPASASADSSAVHHLAGSTSVPSGCAARPWRSSAPVSASRMTTLQDCVEESIPATSAIAVHLRVGLSVGDDADLAAGPAVGNAVGLGCLGEREPVRDHVLGMPSPAHQELEQVRHVPQRRNPRSVHRYQSVDQQLGHREGELTALASDHSAKATVDELTAGRGCEASIDCSGSAAGRLLALPEQSMLA